MRNTCIVLASFTVLSCGAVFGEAEGSFERKLNVTEAVDLDVQTSSGRIEVRAGNSSTVAIHATIRVREGIFGSESARGRVRAIESHPPIQQIGDVIRIDHMDFELRAHSGSGSIRIQ